MAQARIRFLRAGGLDNQPTHRHIRMPSLAALIVVYVKQVARIRALSMGTRENGHPATVSQRERFEQAAREAGADEDGSRWDERLKKVVKVKPVPGMPE